MRVLNTLTLAITVFISFAVICQRSSANIQQREEALLKPDFIKIEIKNKRFEVSTEQLTGPYRRGDKVFFELFITNTSTELILLPVADAYFQNRLQLLKDGQQVLYRKAVSNLIESKDKSPVFGRTDVLRLDPYETKRAELINLSNWYDPLEPGHYELVVKHRFMSGGEWVESPAVEFEVQPK